MSATDPDEALPDEIVRTAQNYDRLQYDSMPFPHSQPARLGGLAQYFGLDAAPLATARVLELGGASGGNIIPHALRYPNAQFIGVDLGRAQILAGQARIERLGLTNIELRCESLTEIDESWGAFDYIICHGVYSWVPKFVQNAIFRVMRERLSPSGIACVSYNVLPGWRMLQPFRDALLLMVPENVDTAYRVAASRDLLAFMHARASDPGPYGDMLRSWGERLATAADYYLAHEYLEDENSPQFVRDVVAAAAGHRLGYLCDCDISTMMSVNYGPETAQYIQMHTNGDLIATEQYLDIITGRTFRQSIFVGEERLKSVDRLKSPASLFGRQFVIRDGVTLEQEGDQYVVKDVGGAWVRTPSSAAAEGIARLIERSPSSSTVEDCINAIAGRGNERDRSMLLDTLYSMVSSYILIPTSEPVQVPPPSDRPRVSKLARLDASEGAEGTTNIRHEPVPIGPVMRVLLPIMDGTRDHAALIDVLIGEALAGRLSFTRGDQPVSDPDGVRQIAEEQLPGMLARVARLGLLED
jgi:methyltransferase-like protein/2-polyprenyl-3-methyl-5-hydroxy-6-metoxy-1,4-benzoquinol methylase